MLRQTVAAGRHQAARAARKKSRPESYRRARRRFNSSAAFRSSASRLALSTLLMRTRPASKAAAFVGFATYLEPNKYYSYACKKTNRESNQKPSDKCARRCRLPGHRIPPPAVLEVAELRPLLPGMKVFLAQRLRDRLDLGLLLGFPYAFLYGHQDNDVPTFWPQYFNLGFRPEV